MTTFRSGDPPLTRQAKRVGDRWTCGHEWTRNGHSGGRQRWVCRLCGKARVEGGGTVGPMCRLTERDKALLDSYEDCSWDGCVGCPEVVACRGKWDADG